LEPNRSVRAADAEEAAWRHERDA